MKILKWFSFVFIIFLLCINILALSERLHRAIVDENILDNIANEVSGGICFEHIKKLATLHRIWGSEDYHEAAQYLINKSNEYGLKNAMIERYPIKTGEEFFWMHCTEGFLPWNCKAGELRLVKPYPMLITSYESAASTVADYSRSTDDIYELIYVGKGNKEDNYKGKDIKGKIVLAEDAGHTEIHELAVHHFSAAGSMVYHNLSGNFKESEGIYRGRIYPWSKDKTKPSTFGINISTSQGLFFKNLISKGEKVLVSVKIDADIIEDGAFELATAIIPGTKYPDEEFIFYAHLDHEKPGAHDNASGDAVLLEIARTLSRLIEKKIIPAPHRTIRFMWIPHMHGLNMYLYNHQDKIGKIKAGCNIDSVGLNQVRFSSQFFVRLPPHSLPSYLTDITNNLVHYFNNKMRRSILQGSKKDSLFSAEGSTNVFSVTILPFSGGSDEYTANTRSLNIPSLRFIDFPIPPRHSQINFLEYIDSTTLKRVSYLGAIISYAFASINEGMILNLINEIYERTNIRLREEIFKAKFMIEQADKVNLQEMYMKGKNLLLWDIKREEGMLNSVFSLIENRTDLQDKLQTQIILFKRNSKQTLDDLNDYYHSKCKELHIIPKLTLKESQFEVSLKNIIPILNPEIRGSTSYFKGYFEKKLGENFIERYKIKPRFRYGYVGYYETMNYIDGKNSILDIYNAVQAELISEDYDPVHFLSLEETFNYIKMLKDSNVLMIKSSFNITKE